MSDFAASAALPSPLSCVVCRAPLGQLLGAPVAEMECAQCGKRFPCVHDSIPILLRDPEWHVASTYATIASFIRSEDARLGQVEHALQHGLKRLPALRRIAAGMARNRELYRRWLQLLEQSAPAAVHLTRGSGEADKDNTGYTSIFRYLFQDWSRSIESEQVIGLIRDHLRRDLAEHAPALGHTVVLGAGTGRIAHELARPAVWALDLSLPMALTYGLLRREELLVCDPTEYNTYSVEDLFRETRLSAQGSSELAGYLVADALHMPFADRSISALLSVYFTDVVPLSILLRETARVLRPGGALIHFGPLGYSFYQPDEMWTVEEVRQLLAQRGYRLRAERLVPHVLSPNPRRISEMHINAWSFVATYEP